MCHRTEADGVGEMAEDGCCRFFACRHFLDGNEEIDGEKCSERGSHQKRKTVLRAGALKKSKLSLSYLDSFLGIFDVHTVLDVSSLVFWRNAHNMASFLALDKWR